MSKIYNVGGFDMKIDTPYEEIAEEDLKYFEDLPQISQFEQMGFNNEQAIEILYETLNITTSSIFGIKFADLKKEQKEVLRNMYLNQAAAAA